MFFVSVDSHFRLAFPYWPVRKPAPQGVVTADNLEYCAPPLPLLPVVPYSARSFSSLIKGIPFMNGSSVKRHAADTEGKNPHLLAEPKLDDPSALPANCTMYLLS